MIPGGIVSQEQNPKEAEFARVKAELERKREAAIQELNNSYVALYKSRPEGTTYEEDEAAVAELKRIRQECEAEIAAARERILGVK